MSIRYPLICLAAILIAQPVFAKDDNSDEACMKIVKPCLDAGYSDNGPVGKLFWQDCMKPLVMGEKVTGITVAANDVKVCREGMIKELEEKLKELKSVK